MIRLSDAIALGRKVVEPAKGLILSTDGKRGCALGMGFVGAGLSYSGSQVNCYLDIKEKWDWLCLHTNKWPCFCNRGLTVYMDLIAHIFDNHVRSRQDWTLDQLIDYVRSIEPPESESAAPVVETPTEKVSVNG